MDTPASSPLLDSAIVSGLDHAGAGRRRLEAEILAAYLPRCRWFGGKARGPRRFEIRDVVPLDTARILFVHVEYQDGSADTYQLFVAVGRREAVGELPPEAILAGAGEAVLYDALYAEETRAAIYRLMTGGEARPGMAGEIRGIAADDPELAGVSGSRLLKVEQSNSSIVYGERVFLKLYRKLEEGVNPDAEITRFLSERQSFAHVPAFAGALEYRLATGGVQVLGLALGLVLNRGDAWTWALAAVSAALDRLPMAKAVPPSSRGLFDKADADDAGLLGADFLARCRQLGTRTGELHLALAADTCDPDFAPEPFTNDDARELAAAIRASLKRLPSTHDRLSPLVMTIEERAAELAAADLRTCKTRTHGDYHLGQVLETGEDFVIIDFEGEPLRSLAERRCKRSPLRDVAGMLRSFHYAAHATLIGREDRALLEPWAERWSEAASRVFFGGWLEATRGALFVPESRAELTLLLDAFLLEKALYEVAYELNNRPAWLPIPLRGVERVLTR